MAATRRRSSFGPTGRCVLCSLHTPPCGSQGVIHTLVVFFCVCLACWFRSSWRDGPVQGWPQRRPEELFTRGRTFQVNPSLAVSGTCHVTPSWYPIVTCLYPGLWSLETMDSPQSQPVPLTFVSIPAASLIASCALATGYILGLSSDVPSLTPDAGLGQLCAHPCAWVVPKTHLVPQVTSSLLTLASVPCR